MGDTKMACSRQAFRSDVEVNYCSVDTISRMNALIVDTKRTSEQEYATPDLLILGRGVVYRQKKGGGGKRAVSPQCEVRLKMATAEPAWGRPNHRKSYAMLCGWAAWGRFLCFWRGSGSFGSTVVTNINGSTGYLTSETNLRQDPPLIWVFGHFWLFCTMV